MATVELAGAEEKSAPTPAPQGKLTLEIDVSTASIADMQAIDRMGSPVSGAFADAVDVMARFVTNMDIRTRPRHELKAIAEAIMGAFRDDGGN